ncbi:transposase domain-containing protein [Xanthobacter oligotrophicus]|nr:transposase domain-containing protein [Xanthobacter oligotrophicus]MCG5233947.1 transposase domain-containing protein [Xanthobacter oligotrophicus]
MAARSSISRSAPSAPHITDVLQRMVDGHPLNRLDELLPQA